MSRQPPVRMAAGIRGFGLMEVLVALSVGVFLLGAVSYLFLGSRQLDRAQGDVSRMQETGRIAMEILGKPIRQAGARSDVSADFPGAALAATEGTSGAPDSLTVRYDAQEGGEVNCLGATVASGPVTFVFTVDTTAKELRCSDGTGAAPVVMMDNIENMQITYGIDSDRNGSIESYQSASGLTANQVNAVRVSLLVVGPSEGVLATSGQTYSYDGASATSSDRHLRQVYSSTFTVRNQAK
jgi:type IV pilus assembly protein PilW